MKKDLLEWWKGKLNNGVGFGYTIAKTKKGWYFISDNTISEFYDTIDQAYEASLIHYLQQNKALLEIVFDQGLQHDPINTFHDRFELWFKEVTE